MALPTIEELKIANEFENEILELIDGQTSEYESPDGMDYSMTRSDLQGVVSALVLKILNKGKELEQAKK